VPRPRSDIRPRVLRAARKRFLAEGVDGASLRRIAEEAGTSIGMIYYYFPTKDALFMAVVEEQYERILADLERALAHDAPVEERILRLFTRAGQMSDDEMVVVRIIVREALVSKDRVEPLIVRFARGHLPLILDLLLDGRSQGLLRDDVPPFVQLATLAGTGMLPQVMHRLLGEASSTWTATLPPGSALAPYLAEIYLRGTTRRPAGEGSE
jgi:AcrR family transcriptional regulator